MTDSDNQLNFQIDISVIVAVYNVEKFLTPCLESLRLQTLKNAEFIVIDDGSTDGCGSICDKYEQLDSRFRVLHQPNKGMVIARERGIEIARGKWSIFVDGDDFLPSDDVLSTELELANTNNVDILRFSIDVLAEAPDKKEIFLNFRGDFLGGLCSSYEIMSKIFESPAVSWTLWDKIYRTSVLKQTLPFVDDKISLPCAADVYHVFLICFFSSSLLSIETKPLYTYRHGVGVSTGRITLSKYNKYAQEPKLLSYLANFLKTENKLEEYQSILDALSLRLKKTSVYRYLALEKEDAAAGFDCLINNNPIDSIIDVLYSICRSRVVELAEKIYGSHVMQNRVHKVKTIALYFEAYNLGGVQRVISQMMPTFLSLGYKVILITDRVDEVEFPKPEEVIRVVIPGKYEDGRAKALAETIRNHDIDLVLHHGGSSAHLLFDLIVIKSLGRACVVQSHELTLQSLIYSGVGFKSKPSVFRLADAVVVLNLMELNFYIEKGVLVRYIPNPITFADNLVKKTKLDALQKLKSGRTVLWVGRLDNTQKNYKEALEIFKNVICEIPDVVCYMVARGLPKEYDFVSSYISKNNLEGKVKLIQTSPHPETYYRLADVQLITSSYESFPMVIVESKAFGIPLVLYEMPYLELLKDKKGYIPVARHDKKAACSRIVQVLTNDELRQKLSQEARQSLEDFVSNTLETSTYWQNLIGDLVQEKTAVNSTDKTLTSSEQLELNLLFWNTAMSFYQEGVDRFKRTNLATAKKLKDSQSREGLLAKKLKDSQSREGLLSKKLKDSLSREKLSARKLKASLLREASLKQSVSFRVGRVITWLPRKIRGGWRCLKEHGVTYTIKRLWWHIVHLK